MLTYKFEKKLYRIMNSKKLLWNNKFGKLTMNNNFGKTYNKQ
jgi:hypothetical protein